MLSNSRIYIFNINYMNSDWLSDLQANQLAGLISNLFTDGIKNLTFKNLNFINVFESTLEKKIYSCQLHIEKIIYKESKILCKEYIAELRNLIRAQLRKISMLKFGNVLIVNDEFNFTSTQGYLIEDSIQVEQDIEQVGEQNE
jgi:hypothetical protein